MLKIICFSCWRFFNCELSHRYVIKMYCPSFTMLGYTSHQSRKFEKLISTHLNNPLLPLPIFRSSHQRCSKKAAPKNLAIFTTRKHLRWSLFLIKLQSLRPGTLLRRLQHRCFPVNIAKPWRTSIFKIICKRLLLPLEVFCIQNLLILAMAMLHLVFKKTLYGCSLSIF